MQGKSTMSSAIGKADNYTQWVLSCFKPFFGEKILEIGTGQGNYKGFIKNPLTYVSVDIDQELINEARAKDPSGEYYICDVASNDFKNVLAGKSFDTVLCTNVLEHVRNDEEVLKNVYSVLNPGGRFLLFVPAFPSLYSDMDKLAGHFRRYVKKDIENLAKKTSFKIIKNEYFNPIGGLGWWINKFKTYNDLNHQAINSQILFFDKHVLPMSKFINPLTKNFWGQSLVIVLEK